MKNGRARDSGFGCGEVMAAPYQSCRRPWKQPDHAMLMTIAATSNGGDQRTVARDIPSIRRSCAAPECLWNDGDHEQSRYLAYHAHHRE